MKRGRRRGKRHGIALAICTFLYAVILTAISILNAAGPDRWWFGAVNLYLPQWIWGIPCAVLIPWYLIRARRRFWIPILLAGWVLGPIMGWNFGLSQFATHGAGPRLRVMTYNIKWGRRDAAGVLANVRAAHPDVVVMQDSNGATESVLAALIRPGWHVIRFNQYTVLSKYVISDEAERWLDPDSRHSYIRCTLHVGKHRVALYDVHMMTPRYALATLKEAGSESVGGVLQNAGVRTRQSMQLCEHIRRDEGPFIVAGDLNSPIQAVACQNLLSIGLRDAFSEAGRGYGYTYGQSTRLHAPFLRIDHIMVSPEWDVETCRVGSPRGSDHSPVITDLRLREE